MPKSTCAIRQLFAPRFVFFLWGITVGFGVACQPPATETPDTTSEVTSDPQDGESAEALLLATSEVVGDAQIDRSPSLTPWVNCGIDFKHQSGATGEFTYPEILCGGVCLADLDGDGDLDAYFPQGGQIPGSGPATTPRTNSPALFMNDGEGRFSPAASQIETNGTFGMGAFAADVDGDSDLDLLLTNVGKLQLLINDGTGKFAEIRNESGLPQDDGFWLNAAFADYDGDGHLDVYVANYVSWKYGVDVGCTGPAGRPDYCAPKKYAAMSDLLLRGNGDGTFIDVSAGSGVAAKLGRSMGVVALDIELDGDLDIYVACDGEENLLWVNQGDGTFLEEAMLRGAALNAAGAAEASMGIACADVDADGDEDILISHLADQTHTLYRNDGGFFVDITSTTGLGAWSRPDTGFGICLVDFDNDRNLDILVANGAVIRPTRAIDADSPYAQPDRLVRGVGGARFPEASVIRVGSEPHHATVTRGLAYGDLNGDGRVDAIIAAKDSPPFILKNETQTEHAWIGIRPVLKSNGPSVLNAVVVLPEIPQIGPQTVRPHSSYLGSSEDVARFGLGEHTQPLDVQVTWPNGDVELFARLPLRQIHRVQKGHGKK